MKLPDIGKLDEKSFDEIIFSRLGASSENVLIGPQHGVDGAAVYTDKQKEEVMVVAEDPTFGMPALLPYFGWSIVHISASDVAVMGVPPKYMTICLLLPPKSDKDLLVNIWQGVHEECQKLGITIIGGHTGVYPGIDYPLNGGCTMIGMGKKEDLTPPSNAKIGDNILITKGPAIEAVGVLANQASDQLQEKYGGKTVEKAKEYLLEMTVVKDSLLSAEYANAMHDATEGGLLNGIYEIAAASNVGCKIYEEKIKIPKETAQVCEYFEIDPLTSISEGTLIVTAPPDNTRQIKKKLSKENISSWVIGEIVEEERTFVRKSGNEESLKPVKVDPFWNAYFQSLQAE